MAGCLSTSSQQSKVKRDLLAQLEASDDDDYDVEDVAENNAPAEPEFSFPNSSTCWICNGYYGPNFGEPLCGPCHAFLYNEQRVEELLTQISDDEDSGNDEPPFKDKQEDDEVENDADIMGFEDLDAEEVPPPIENNEVVPAVAIEAIVVAVEEEQPQRFASPEREFENEHAANPHLLPMKRPRPAGPPLLVQFMNDLNEPNARPLEAPGGVDKINSLIPVEVKLKIFAYLDDMSLWMCSQVCQQWRDIIEKNTLQLMWKSYLAQRWPLFHSLIEVNDWYKLYGALMTATFCRTCLLEVAVQSTPPSVHQNAIRNNLLRNEAYLLNSYETEGIQAIPLGRENNYWQATIIGPSGSPYEGGKFFLFIYFPESYPMLPPTVRFLTKILHPNVSRHGDVGIDIFQQQNWSLALNVAKVLLSVQSLLTDPYTEICMEPLLGYMYENERAQFERLARSWTWKYAMFELISPT